MKKCPNCDEWIGDNADVCFNCSYDFISKKVISVSAIKQREEKRMADARQQEEQRRRSARAKAEQQIADEKQKNDVYEMFQSARYTTLKEKLKINDLYEYDVAIVYDKPSGEINTLALCAELEKHGREGWRLVNTFTNELGVNAASIAGFGTNATIEETILIFERCIKRA